MITQRPGGSARAGLHSLGITLCGTSSEHWFQIIRAHVKDFRDDNAASDTAIPNQAPGMVRECVETGLRASLVDEGTVRLSSKGESDRITQRSLVQIQPPQPRTPLLKDSGVHLFMSQNPSCCLLFPYSSTEVGRYRGGPDAFGEICTVWLDLDREFRC